MTACINLLNPALRPRRAIASARQLALLVAVTFAALALATGYVEHVTARAHAARAAARDAHDARIARLSTLQQAEREAAASEAGVDVRRLEAELRAQREGLALLRSGAAGAREGYAEYLRAFSRGALNGLWLTGFTLAGSGDITLRGRLTRAELLPDYMHRLSAQSILSGRTFAALDVTRPAVERADGADAEYLEFTLATSERHAVAQAGGRAP